MKSQLILVAVFAIILCAHAYRRKRNLENCESLVCPEDTVKCTMTEDNKEDTKVIVTKLECKNDKDVVLREDIKTRPNEVAGMKISRQKTSVNINKSVHSSHANKQSWDMQNGPRNAAIDQTFWQSVNSNLNPTVNFDWNSWSKNFQQKFAKMNSWGQPAGQQRAWGQHLANVNQWIGYR